MKDLSWSRRLFPALDRQVDGRDAVFFDGPGGTQVPRGVIDAMAGYLVEANANAGGAFVTTRLTDAVIAGAREAAATLLGADADEIAVGPSMTGLCYSLAFGLARDLDAGDRIVITDMDHEANRGPWLDLAERGVEVVSAPVDPSTCLLDVEAMLSLIDERTRVVAAGWASNAVGTVTDLRPIVAAARQAGAVSVVDAVHYVPHMPVDVRALGADYLLFSAYKVFGPHLGVLYGRREAFRRLRTYRIAPQRDTAPHKIEAGTLNHEAMAGLEAAVAFIAGLTAGGEGSATDRAAVLAGMEAVARYEDDLRDRLLAGLEGLDRVRVHGPPPGHPRTPTVSFTVDGVSSPAVSEQLGGRGIFTWAGHFYASTLVRRLGLDDRGGLVRVGFAPYNTASEVDRFLEEMATILGRAGG